MISVFNTFRVNSYALSSSISSYLKQFIASATAIRDQFRNSAFEIFEEEYCEL